MAKRDSLPILIRHLQNTPSDPRKLKVLLGDGYDPTEELLYPSRIIGREVPKPTDITDKEHVKIWLIYEYARLKTSNQLPDALLYYLLRMAKENIISRVFTTNYDCYWVSIAKRKAFDLPLSINPFSPQPTLDGYYTRPLSKKNLPIYIIHGRLDFSRFNRCLHRFPLPDFMPGWTFKKIRATASTNKKACGVCNMVNLQRHDIDWLNDDNRLPYEPEIQITLKEIADEETTAGILILGFSGYHSSDPADHRKNEEIVPEIQEVAMRGKIPIWIVNTRRQWETMHKHRTDNYLRWKLMKFEKVIIIPPVESTIHVWLANVLLSSGIKIYDWERQYKTAWINGGFFDKRGSFRKRVAS